jgi:hypothetical protein
MRLYRSDAGWLEREKDIRADAVIVSMSPTKLSRHGCIPAEPAAVSPGKIIVPRIVIGGVILDQPAGGGIGAVGVGSLCGYGGHGRSCPGREKNALDSARSRLWSATSKSTTSRLAWLRSDLMVLLLYRCLVRTKSHKARQKAAGSVLSVKLEKYLSRPDYEGHISFIETLHEGLPQDGIGCPRGIRTPRC